MGGIVNSTAKILLGDPNESIDEFTKPIRDFKPTNFSSNGLSGNFDDGTFSITRGDLLSGSLADIKNRTLERGSQFSGLINEVNPAFGALNAANNALASAGVANINNARRRTIGTLRDNLSKRRVLGSSFAQDALARGEAEFAREEANIIAQNERSVADNNQRALETRISLINEQTQASIQAASIELNQLNLESQLSANIANNLTNTFSSLASLESQLIQNQLVEFQGGRAAIVGSVAGAATKAATSGG